MPKASEIKKNNTLAFDGKTCIVRDIERSVPVAVWQHLSHARCMMSSQVLSTTKHLKTQTH